MVERRPDARDRRIWRLHLLPQAYEVLHEIDQQRAEISRNLTTGIDGDTLAVMTEALLRMKATLTQDAHAARRNTESSQADAKEAV
jgi:MarR family transcriptional regulator, transcriptional regulator for hemolysin